MAERREVRISNRIVVPEQELTWRYGPSGGPGGQHANTSNTRVELVWEIEGTTAVKAEEQQRLLEQLGPRVRIVVDDTRSQSRNRDLAIDRLEAQVREGLVVKRSRRKTKPKRGAIERRLKAKKQQSDRKASRRTPFD